MIRQLKIVGILNGVLAITYSPAALVGLLGLFSGSPFRERLIGLSVTLMAVCLLLSAPALYLGRKGAFLPSVFGMVFFVSCVILAIGIGIHSHGLGYMEVSDFFKALSPIVAYGMPGPIFILIYSTYQIWLLKELIRKKGDIEGI